MGAGVVHQYDSIGVHLSKEAPNLLLAQPRIAVTEQHVDGPVYLRLKAGLVAVLNPLCEPRTVNPLLRFSEDHRIVLAGDYLPKAIGLEPLRDRQRADAHKRSGFDYCLRLDRRD